MLYGESSQLGHHDAKNAHEGADVYIRYKEYIPEKVDCGSEIDGGGWKLVRHTKGTGGWGPFIDHLAGTEELGDASSSVYDDWSVSWTVQCTTQMLFAFGDCSQWLITTPDAVNGENYANQPRSVIKSSSNPNPHSVKWYNRGA